MINQIHNESCMDTMARMPSDYIDLTVTSPPYDNLRKYQDDIDKTWNDEVWKPIIKELFRVTKDGGVVVWVVGDATINGSETGTSFKQALWAMECGFKLYDTMIWNKQSPAAPTESRYYDVFEYMFIFSKGTPNSKGTPKILNLIADRVNVSAGSKSRKETRSCREDRKYTGKMRTINDRSRRFNVWDVSRGQNTTSHPAVFPENLAADHIKSWSNEGDLIYDPFGGSGTTIKMAKLLNRNWIMSEVSKEYCDIAHQRIDFNDLFLT